MMKYIYGSALTLAFFGMVLMPSAQVHAETSTSSTTIEAMMTQIKALMAQLAELQKKSGAIQSDIKGIIKDGLKEGMSDADIQKVQELLATDPTIYPEGKVTGYFGPLTKDALKRFQARHGASTTGEIDEDTRDLLEEYLHEGFGDKIPPGLLHAPGIMKKVADRFRLGCESATHVGMGPLCKKYHDEHGDDHHDDDEDENDDEDDSDNGEFDVEVVIDGGNTALEFTFDGDDYEVDVDSTDLEDVLDAAADEIDDGDDASDLDEDLASEIEDALDAANDDASDAKDDAKDEMDAAQVAIDNAQDDIDADDGDNTDEAQEILDDAQDKLDAAQDAYDDAEYADAKDLAEDAQELAEDAEDAL